MHSIRTKITLLAVIGMVVVMTIAMVFGVNAIRNIGNSSSNQLLLLLCETGEKNLDSYFDSVEQSVEMVSAYVEEDLDKLDDKHLQEHLDRVDGIFKKMTYKNNGILTYYYRIDPKVSKKAKGFWYVNQDGEGFKEHEVTDITKYDTDDTSQLVWFTVPKATGKGVWLPPYITDNLGARVLSYNVPVYKKGKFVGVIGIEIDYSTMAEQVDNITLYENGYAFINDKDGTIIYHPRIDVEELAKNHPKIPPGLMSDKRFIRYNFDGVEKMAVWLPLHNGMRLNVSVPVAEINTGWQKWSEELIIIFCILLLAFIIVILRFTGRITKPLRDLTEAAEQVNEDNYDVKMEYTGDDEVGILSQAFNRLIDHLKSYIGDLNDLAYADALTSVHNKGAFDIYVRNLQQKLDDPGDEETEFAVCMFDCNDLKEINDQFGHEKGDQYLKGASKLICDVFAHSPVFRIGGDEFVAFLLNKDYRIREDLCEQFDEACYEKMNASSDLWKQINVAWGMAVYDPKEDKTVDEVVRRADKFMYENKRQKKEEAGADADAE